MHLLGSLLRSLARLFSSLAGLFFHLSKITNGFLPALLPPPQLTALVQEFYRSNDMTYSEDLVREHLEKGYVQLTHWESMLLDRWHVRAGRILVMGCGWGREAIAMAPRDLTVVGVDSNLVALRAARVAARAMRVPAFFHQANYTELPYASGSFDFAVLFSIMYSSIPGARLRQAFLSQLSRILKPNGLAILNFHIQRQPPSRLGTLRIRLNRLLAQLPGANRVYQPGDSWDAGHFLHAFQDEDEIRNELVGAGVWIEELIWTEGFAVIRYPPSGRWTSSVPQFEASSCR